MSFRALLCVGLLLLPGLALAQPGNPHDPRNFTWVREGVLAVAGGGLTEEDAHTVKELGFGAVANFRAEHQDPEETLAKLDIEYVYMPVEYALDINVSMLQSFVAWAKDQEADGRVIYAHCISGWHRAATFAIAWLMEREGLTYDEAASEVAKARQGTALRVPSTLLAYEAELTGKPGLYVMMNAPKAHSPPGGELPITIDVFAHGKPLAGASLKVWAEGGKPLAQGVTDENGRFLYTHHAKDDAYLTYLFARASSPGFVDGADNIEMYHFLPVPKNYPITLETEVLSDGIAVTILDEGEPVSARLLASTADGWSRYDAPLTGRTTFPLPPAGGDVTIRASRFGEPPISVVVPLAPRASAPPGGEPGPGATGQDPAPSVEPPETDPGAPAPARDDTPPASGSRAWVPMALGAAVVALGAMGALYWSRRGRGASR